MHLVSGCKKKTMCLPTLGAGGEDKVRTLLVGGLLGVPHSALTGFKLERCCRQKTMDEEDSKQQ